MPLGKGKFRVTKDGVRLHFTPSGKVNEAKNIETGKTHTPKEFAADRKARGSGKGGK